MPRRAGFGNGVSTCHRERPQWAKKAKHRSCLAPTRSRPAGGGVGLVDGVRAEVGQFDCFDVSPDQHATATPGPAQTTPAASSADATTGPATTPSTYPTDPDNPAASAAPEGSRATTRAIATASIGSVLPRPGRVDRSRAVNSVGTSTTSTLSRRARWIAAARPYPPEPRCRPAAPHAAAAVSPTGRIRPRCWAADAFPAPDRLVDHRHGEAVFVRVHARKHRFHMFPSTRQFRGRGTCAGICGECRFHASFERHLPRHHPPGGNHSKEPQP